MVQPSPVRNTYVEVAKSIRYKKCLRHPGKVLVVQVDRTTGNYIPWCVECYREGLDGPQIAPDHYQARRLGEMVNQELEKRPTEIIATRVEPEERPMAIAVFDEQIALIKHVVEVMQENVHYGLIPGTYDKSLWEPGAEYLRAAFRISWSYELTRQVEDWTTGDFRYEFRCFTVPPTQAAEWVASAWSKERKFWCHRDCPTACDRLHEPAMEKAMLPHNVKDRALKRAFVALMRNVTGTSGWFKQALDVEQENGTTSDAQCPKHKGLRFTMLEHWVNGQKVKTMSHVIPGEKGPKGGRVYCEMAETSVSIRNAPETPASAPSGSYEPVIGRGDTGSGSITHSVAFDALVTGLPRPTTLKILDANAKLLGYSTPQSIRDVIGIASDLVDLEAAQYKLIQNSPLRPQEVAR